MPIYEYVCGGCDKSFEVLVRTAGEKISCPHCGGTKATRKFSTFAAHGAAAADAPACAEGQCPAGMMQGGCGGGKCPLSG